MRLLRSQTVIRSTRCLAAQDRHPQERMPIAHKPLKRPLRGRRAPDDPDQPEERRLARGRLRADVQRQERGDDPPAAPRGDRRAARRHLQAADRRPLRRGRRRQPRRASGCARSRSAASPSSSSAPRGFEVVGIDEAQFFEHEIVGAALALADGGARVIAAGLDQDFRRLPFGPMPELLAHAEFVDKLQAVCHRCGGGRDDDAAARRRQPGAVLRRDDRRRRERAVRGALPRLPRGRRGPRDSRGLSAI